MKIRSHVQQQDQSDCGIACLKSALKHFGAASVSFERLRELSGTSRQGTSMLGLMQAGQECGLQVKAFQATIDQLKECRDLCILHILKEDRLKHFVVYYGYNVKQDKLLIGDPAERQIESWKDYQLQSVWKSHALLLLKPGPKMQKREQQRTRQWNWLVSLVKEDMPLLGMTLAFGLVISILGLATAIFSQQLLDHILPSGDRLRLFLGAGLLCLLLMARSCMSYLRGSFLLRQSRDFNLRILGFFFGRLLDLPKPFFDNRRTGDLLTRMNDTQRIQRTVGQAASTLMIDVLLVLAASIAIFVYDWRMGLLSLSWLPVFGALVYGFHPKILSHQKKVMQARARNESNYIDAIQGMGTIKINNKQPVFRALTQGIYQWFLQTMLDMGKISIRFQLLTGIISSVFICGVVAWSGWFVLSDQMTAGSLIAVLQLIGLLMTSGSGLANANIQLQEARVAFDRMYEFASIESEYDPEEDSSRAEVQKLEELQVNNLRFRFPGRKAILEDISFTIKRGEWITIMGESGSGKSTLLQILQKFYKPESGKLKANGINLDLLGFEAWRNILGVVPQEIKLFGGTILDNLLLGHPPETEEEWSDFLRRYGIDSWFSNLPHGLKTVVGEEGINLSGGQKQLLGLARALWKQPQLLLLDEPTAALDRDTEQKVLGLLNKLRSDMAILLLTHRLSTAKLADRIYVMNQGKIANQGKHKDLLQGENLYSRAWTDLIKEPELRHF